MKTYTSPTKHSFVCRSSVAINSYTTAELRLLARVELKCGTSIPCWLYRFHIDACLNYIYVIVTMRCHASMNKNEKIVQTPRYVEIKLENWMNNQAKPQCMRSCVYNLLAVYMPRNYIEEKSFVMKFTVIQIRYHNSLVSQI